MVHIRFFWSFFSCLIVGWFVSHNKEIDITYTVKEKKKNIFRWINWRELAQKINEKKEQDIFPIEKCKFALKDNQTYF